jgi:hypothetical protein
VHGPQEIALVVEVVVERAAGDVGRAHDLLGRDAGVPALREQLARGREQPRARRLGTLRLRRAHAGAPAPAVSCTKVAMSCAVRSGLSSATKA